MTKHLADNLPILVVKREIHYVSTVTVMLGDIKLVASQIRDNFICSTAQIASPIGFIGRLLKFCNKEFHWLI